MISPRMLEILQSKYLESEPQSLQAKFWIHQEWKSRKASE